MDAPNGEGAVGVKLPKSKFKNNFKNKISSKYLRDLPFHRNQPMKSSDV